MGSLDQQQLEMQCSLICLKLSYSTVSEKVMTWYNSGCSLSACPSLSLLSCPLSPRLPQQYAQSVRPHFLRFRVSGHESESFLISSRAFTFLRSTMYVVYMLIRNNVCLSSVCPVSTQYVADVNSESAVPQIIIIISSGSLNNTRTTKMPFALCYIVDRSIA